MKVTYFDNILELVFPKTCFSCKDVLVKNERTLCLKCYLSIPKIKDKKEIFVNGKKYNLYSPFHYKKKGIIQLLIHQLKYNQNKRIGIYFSECLFSIIKHLKDIDCIVPVPISQKKKKIRGYNQSELIAKGLSELLGCRIINSLLIRHENEKSQTLKSRYMRFDEIEGAFSINEKYKIEYKHILLLDDVFTTGATISECIKTLNQLNNISISVVCVAS